VNKENTKIYTGLIILGILLAVAGFYLGWLDNGPKNLFQFL